jgi:hypothetical protein
VVVFVSFLEEYLKRGYQCTRNLVKDENDELLADSPQHFEWVEELIHLLNIHKASFVRELKVHTSEPLVPDASSIEVEMV